MSASCRFVFQICDVHICATRNIFWVMFSHCCTLYASVGFCPDDQQAQIQICTNWWQSQSLESAQRGQASASQRMRVLIADKQTITLPLLYLKMGFTRIKMSLWSKEVARSRYIFRCCLAPHRRHTQITWPVRLTPNWLSRLTKYKS